MRIYLIVFLAFLTFRNQAMDFRQYRLFNLIENDSKVRAKIDYNSPVEVNLLYNDYQKTKQDILSYRTWDINKKEKFQDILELKRYKNAFIDHVMNEYRDIKRSMLVFSNILAVCSYKFLSDRNKSLLLIGSLLVNCFNIGLNKFWSQNNYHYKQKGEISYACDKAEDIK